VVDWARASRRAGFSQRSRLPWLNSGTVMPKILPKFLGFSSHRIFEHMYEALNIDKK
jgi:hypothetical protein